LIAGQNDKLVAGSSPTFAGEGGKWVDSKMSGKDKEGSFTKRKLVITGKEIRAGQGSTLTSGTQNKKLRRDAGLTGRRNGV